MAGPNRVEPRSEPLGLAGRAAGIVRGRRHREHASRTPRTERGSAHDHARQLTTGDIVTRWLNLRNRCNPWQNKTATDFTDCAGDFSWQRMSRSLRLQSVHLSAYASNAARAL